MGNQLTRNLALIPNKKRIDFLSLGSFITTNLFEWSESDTLIHYSISVSDTDLNTISLYNLNISFTNVLIKMTLS